MVVVVSVLFAVVAVVAVVAVAVVGVRMVQGLTEDAFNEATERARDLPTAPGAADPDSGPAGTKYALTAAGIRGFLKAYQQRFGTNRVVDLTLYGDYAIVNVPKPKSRQESWVYRDASGFSGFGGVRATFPGARPVATNRLAVPALMRNIARARARLNVEDPTQTYVIVRFIPAFGTGAEREHLRRQQVQRVGLPGDDHGREGEERPSVPAPVDARQTLSRRAPARRHPAPARRTPRHRRRGRPRSGPPR